MCCSLLDKLKDELKFPKLTSNKRYFHCLYELWAEPTDTGCWTVEWRCFVLSFLLYKGDIKKCFYPTQPPAGPVTLKTNPNSFGNACCCWKCLLVLLNTWPVSHLCIQIPSILAQIISILLIIIYLLVGKVDRSAHALISESIHLISIHILTIQSDFK